MVIIGAVVYALSQFVDANAGAAANYQARDRALRLAPLRFYRSQHPRALVWFYGNDIGFWGPQQRLAAQLADRGYDVVGMDLRAWLAQRPHEAPGARAAAFRAAMASLQERAARELGDTRLPVVLAGHSVGAEIALWQGAMAPPRGLVGVVAISPGARGHLRVTASDLAYGEPTEPGSFAVADMVRDIAAHVRVAIVRGSGDPLRGTDSLLVPARPGLHRVIIPLAGHSMRRLLIAGPLIAGAIDWATGH